MVAALLRRWRSWFPQNRPRAGTITLGQRRLYVLPTRLGLVFMLMLGLMLSGAVNYDVGLGYGLVFWLGSVMMLSAVHANLNLSGLRLSAHWHAAAFAGDSMTLLVGVGQPRARLRPSLRIGLAPALTEFHLAAETQEVALELPAPTRGRQAPPRLTLESRYPFGLFRCWTYLDFDVEEWIYPRPETPPPPLPPQAGATPDGVRWVHGSEEFAGLRPWRSDDPPRLIAWKQSARNNELLVKTFQSPQGRERWLDWNDTSGPTERRLSRLCAWVLTAEAQGDIYGLRLPGTELGPDAGPRHRERCLAALAGF